MTQVLVTGSSVVLVLIASIVPLAPPSTQAADPLPATTSTLEGCRVDCSPGEFDGDSLSAEAPGQTLDANPLPSQVASAALSGPSIEVLYVVPAGVTPAITDVPARIPNTIEAVQVFLDTDVGRRLRVTPGVTTVSVAVNDADTLVEQLEAQGYDDPSTIYLSFAEAGGAAGDPCGFQRDDHAVLLMPVCSIYPGAGAQQWPFEATYLVLHELLHTLGAVPACAPHYDGTGHANDSTRDVLGPGPRDWPNLTVDAGRDDYYDHGIGGCVDTLDSAYWLAPDPCVAGWRDVLPGRFYSDAVGWATCSAITAGTTPYTFSPGATLTRAQMATLLWRYQGEPAVSAPHGFADVASGGYYEAAVRWLVASGISEGTSPTTFSPNSPVTRAQMAALLWRFEGSPTSPGHSFIDVEAGVYYDLAVGWLASTGITSGTSNTTFSPDDPLTRGQAVTFLFRLLNLG